MIGQISKSIRLAAIFLRRWSDGPAGNPAAWLQGTSLDLLRLLEIEVQTTGDLPAGGLLVANHLGYLDILALASVLPCRFVAKADVASWTVFGAFARRGDTIFIDRRKRSDVAAANARLVEALAAPGCTVVFPEGTSSDGRQVLPFYSSLLAPAIAQGSCVTPLGISYVLQSAAPGDSMAYHGEMTLLPHLWNLLRLRGMRVQLAFGAGRRFAQSRKTAGTVLRREVEALALTPHGSRPFSKMKIRQPDGSHI